MRIREYEVTRIDENKIRVERVEYPTFAMQFRRVEDTLEWDGKLEGTDFDLNEYINSGIDNPAQEVARLMREAGDVVKEFLDSGN